jgi:hypothetical protein
MDIVSLKDGESGELLKAEIRIRVESNSLKEFSIIDGLASGPPNREAKTADDPLSLLILAPQN